MIGWGALMTGWGTGMSGDRTARHRDDLFLAATCLIVPLADLLWHHHARGTRTDLAVGVLVLVAAGAVVIARTRPVTGLVTSGTAALLVFATGYRMPSILLGAGICLFRLGLAGYRVRTLVVTSAAAAVVGTGTVVSGDEPLLSLGMVAHLALVVAPVLAGELVRLQRATVRLLLERAELTAQAEHDRQLLRVEEERRRIARELHDVVGHALVTVTVQARVASHLLATRPEFAGEALTRISTAGTKALDELRRIVGALREVPGEETPMSPGPRLEDVGTLVADARAAGTAVTLTLTGFPVPDRIPDSVQVAAYRIVQESLTNVRRHAATTTAEVTVAVDEEAVRVRVCNGPGGAIHPLPPGHGVGLVGMRERAGILGGTLTAGPTADGGFAVDARLPLRPRAEVEPR